jgi:hypothetical protein
MKLENSKLAEQVRAYQREVTWSFEPCLLFEIMC